MHCMPSMNGGCLQRLRLSICLVRRTVHEPRQSSSTLADILYPMRVSEFMRDFAFTRAVRLGACENKLSRLLSGFQVNDAITSCLAADGQVKLAHQGQVLSTRDVARIREGVASGATLIVEDADHYDRRLGSVIDRLTGELVAPCRMNLYRSVPGQEGYQIHYDTHDIFVLQLGGFKRWQVYANTVDWPLFHQKTHPVEPPGEGEVPYLTCELGPGDVLYVPKGHWHVAEALEGSVAGVAAEHLTLAMFLRTGLDFLTWFVGELREDARVRQTLPILHVAPGVARTEEDVASWKTALKCVVDSLVEGFDAMPDSLVRDFMADSVIAKPPRFPEWKPPAIFSATQLLQLASQIVVTRSTAPTCSFRQEGKLRIYFGDKVLELDAKYQRIAERLLSESGARTVADLFGLEEVSDAEVAKVVRLLSVEGLVQLAPHSREAPAR